MFDFLKNRAIKFVLSSLREWIMDEYLEGIGVIKELVWKDQALQVTLELNGLAQPITITAKDIDIAPDASSITVKTYTANMPFVDVALNRFATQTFAVPAGKGRLALQAAKKALGL